VEKKEVWNERVWCGVELRLKEALGELMEACPQVS